MPADSIHLEDLDEQCQESLCCETGRLPVCAGMAFNLISCSHAMLIVEQACRADAQQIWH